MGTMRRKEKIARAEKRHRFGQLGLFGRQSMDGLPESFCPLTISRVAVAATVLSRQLPKWSPEPAPII